MAVPPPKDPWYQRFYGYYRYPYPGCGCLYVLLLFFLLYWLLSLLFAPMGFWAR